MRVFVIGTGRCGSVSFRTACSYITNFASGHETLCGLREYPDQFIEVNPHLRLSVVNVSGKYPDARWVHLVRRPDKCIASLASLDRGAVMQAYRILHSSVVLSGSMRDIAFTYYWDAIDSINALLNHRVPAANRIQLNLETIQNDWRMFWDWIGAKGDFESSLNSWNTPTNTGVERGDVVDDGNANGMVVEDLEGTSRAGILPEFGTASGLEGVSEPS